MKVGDVVKIKPFSEGYIDGIWHTDTMMEYIGDIFVIVSKMSNGGCRLNELRESWSEKVLEPATTDKETMVYRWGNFEAVYYNSEREAWMTKSANNPVSSLEILLVEKTVSQLPYDIYGVGKMGDEISTLSSTKSIFVPKLFAYVWGY